jgi:hypothetical protein
MLAGQRGTNGGSPTSQHWGCSAGAVWLVVPFVRPSFWGWCSNGQTYAMQTVQLSPQLGDCALLDLNMKIL